MYIYCSTLLFLQTTEPSEPSSKTEANWERLPNWEVVIQTHPTASIHSRLPRHLEKSILDVIILYLLQYIIFSMKNQAQ
jgi:hypothetical protein